MRHQSTILPAQAASVFATVRMPIALRTKLRAAARACVMTQVEYLYVAIRDQLPVIEQAERYIHTGPLNTGADKTQVYAHMSPALYQRAVAQAKRAWKVLPYRSRSEPGGPVPLNSLSWVLRRCLILQLAADAAAGRIPTPDPATQPEDDIVDPANPFAAPAQRAAPSTLFLLQLPAPVHAWLSTRPNDTVSRQIRVALSTHLQGLPVPATAPITRAAGARLPKSAEGKPVSMRLPVALHQALKTYSDRTGLPMAGIARYCIALHVKAALKDQAAAPQPSQPQQTEGATA